MLLCNVLSDEYDITKIANSGNILNMKGNKEL